MSNLSSTEICREICKSKCCRSTPPALTSEDVDKIKTIVNTTEALSPVKKGSNVLALKKQSNSDDCYFLSENGFCRIYSHRPLDCKLFPIFVKIKKIEEKKYRLKWLAWYCPLTGHKGLESVLNNAKEIVFSYLQSHPHILFEYQSAMYEGWGYKMKKKIGDEIIILDS